MKFNEKVTIEDYVIKFLRSELGYEYISPDRFSRLREFENEYLIASHLVEAIKAINGIDDEIEIQNIVREIKKLDTNQDFLEAMRNGVDLVDAATKKTKKYQLVDWEGDKNHFVATNQFYFEGDLGNIRPDILIFLNGMPICDIEAKSPTSGDDYKSAVNQIKRYEKEARKLFLPNCFNIATDGLKTVYGATYAAKDYFFEWRNELDSRFRGNDREGLEATLEALLSQDKILDIIKNFIVFEKEKVGIRENGITGIKKIMRYQQIRAVNKIIKRVKDGKIKKGLIWHTQGSGKSLTMFFTAWKLRFAKELKNPKVFVLVDRIDLNEQIYDKFIDYGGKNVEYVDSRKDLVNKIINNERGIFISTIQKFNDLPKGTENSNENIIVLVDEGHRTQEGSASIELRYAMKNAFYFAFTGTPIDKKRLNTFRNFGEKGERYLDYYSIQQAIDDGATLPVTYEARSSKFFVDEENIDKQFDDLTSDLDEQQKEQLKKKYGKREAIIKLDRRMEMIIRDIVEHYRLYIEPNGFKAQIVCYDREATARYKELLDKLVPRECSKIVYSPGDRNTDSDDLKKYNTNKSQRNKIIENFKNINSPLKFLLVCDMLLTGFDVPIEQAMYLDKPLRDHNLLQAIARTNRPCPRKGCGRVIDYYGITKNLQDSLDFDESIIESAMMDIDKLKKEFVRLLEKVMNIFSSVDIEDPSNKNLRKCLRIFIDNEKKQRNFIDGYNRLKLLFEILSPDRFLKRYLRKIEWLAGFYLAFAKEFRSQGEEILLKETYGQKMKKIIQESVVYEGITKNYREMTIHDMAILENQYFVNDKERALTLERELKQEISINVDFNPIFKKFSERLMAIKNQFDKNQIDLTERIKRYYEMLNSIKKAKEEAEKLGYDLREQGLYFISKDYIDVKDEDLIKSFIKEMRDRIDRALDAGWQESSKKEQFIKEIKKILQELILGDYKNKIKVNNFSKYLNRLVDIIVKKFKYEETDKT